MQVTFTQDKSKVIRQMLGDLQNSVVTGVLLVAVIILFALGFRASLFIGIAIPASFLAGVLGLQLIGLTVNIVVLFSLILAVGMLVDDAIIVSEYAERRMAEGMPPKEAYSLAAKRMSGPVIAATLTRIAAFSPLLFWPGVVGQFMKYLPITLIATLSASLAVALFFTPTLGALLGKASHVPNDERTRDRGPYMRTVKLVLRYPGTTLAFAAFILFAVQTAYGKFGRGVEFFPNVEPDYGQVIVHGRGNLSLEEKDMLVAEVEKRVLAFDGLATVYARVGEQPRGMGGELTEDTIGVIQFEFAHWQTRRARPRDHGRHPREDRRHPRHPGGGHRAARRPADRKADPGAAVRARSVRAAGGGAEGCRHPVGTRRYPRSRRRPAAARHRLDHPGRQGGGRQVRRRRQHRGRRGAARHQRTEGDRVPPGRERQAGRHPGALPARSAKPRSDRRAVHPDPDGPRADRAFCAARTERRASATSTASTAIA